MTEFEAGDRVRVVGTSATHSSHYYMSSMHPVGTEFTVAGVGKYHSGPFVEDDDGFYWHPDDLELVTEPAPLKEGDAVLVWAKVQGSEWSDATTPVHLPVPDPDLIFIPAGAIVRPAAGQVPPWVEEPEREEVEAIAAALQREGGMPAGAALQMAESLHRAGVRAEVTER